MILSHFTGVWCSLTCFGPMPMPASIRCHFFPLSTGCEGRLWLDGLNVGLVGWEHWHLRRLDGIFFRVVICCDTFLGNTSIYIGYIYVYIKHTHTHIYIYIYMPRSWGILGINVDITRMIINNISGLPRVSPTKLWWCSGGLIIKIYSYFTITWICTLYKDLWKELARSPQKDSLNISARSPWRNSQDFARRILQRNSQVSNLSTRNPQELDTRTLQRHL